MSAHSPLSLMLADADDMKDDEYAAVLDLKPASMLVMCWPVWDADKGVAERTCQLVRDLGHTSLLVRFHADPNPPVWASKNGGPEAWGRLCAQRMTQYYGALEGVTLGVILANEVDARDEGDLSPSAASTFYRRAIDGYLSVRPDDEIHVPAPTGAPDTHRRYLRQYKGDGWLRHEYVIDGHGYDGDFENVINVLAEECPDNPRDITETNDVADFDWYVDVLASGRVRRVHWFTLLWAAGGEGRVRAPNADDVAKHMSLLRYPEQYAKFKATIVQQSVPQQNNTPADPPVVQEPVPTEPVPMSPDPWEHFTANQITEVTGCPGDAVAANWPRLVSQLDLCGINERAVQVAMIGTVAIESASTFAPVREAFYLGEPEPAESYRKTLAYYPFYGRGLIQNTWEKGYRALGPKIAALWGAGADDPTFDLVANPDNLLDPDMSAAAAAIFFRDTATLQGYSLVDAARAGDWEWVRRLVQGGTAQLDRLISIANALSDQPAPIPVPATLTYNPDLTPERQVQSWVCAIRAGTWALKSVGVSIDAGTMQDDMVAHGEEHPTNGGGGLQDHRGYGLADALRRHLPDGTNVEVLEVASWDDLAYRAGRGPLCIGSVSLNHWLNASKMLSAEMFKAPNPAPNYPTGSPLGDEVNRAEFDQWAPWSAVFVEVMPAPAQVDLANLVGNAYAESGVVVPALVGALNGHDWTQVESVIKWLRENRPAA